MSNKFIQNGAFIEGSYVVFKEHTGKKTTRRYIRSGQSIGRPLGHTLSTSCLSLSFFFPYCLIYADQLSEHLWFKQSQIHSKTWYIDAGGIPHRQHGQQQWSFEKVKGIEYNFLKKRYQLYPDILKSITPYFQAPGKSIYIYIYLLSFPFLN